MKLEKLTPHGTKRCTGTNKKNKRCKNPVLFNGKCHQHQDENDEDG